MERVRHGSFDEHRPVEEGEEVVTAVSQKDCQNYSQTPGRGLYLKLGHAHGLGVGGRPTTAVCLVLRDPDTSLRGRGGGHYSAQFGVG